MLRRRIGWNASAFSLLFVLLSAGPSAAYIGPGVGAGTIAAVIGVIAAIGMIVVAVIWYPLKRVIRSMKARNKDPDSG
ncbi:MAG: hypothetical protein AAF501_01720 [Pseudomonadota bacterium]